MAYPGKFLVFEGIDGSGKSTHIRRIHQRLLDEGIEAEATFEPSDGPVGSMIRQMLGGKIKTDQRTIAALFAADRTDHLLKAADGIQALMAQGRVVLCDRYYFSNYAYNSLTMDMEWVITLNALNAGILRPTATLFIDVDPDICLERIRAGRESLDMYEKIDTLKQVRQNYLAAFERFKDSETVVMIDGNGTRDQVEERIWQQVIELVKPGG